MSKKCFEFIVNSFLYNFDTCNDLYQGYSDDDIQNELMKYRDYVIKNYNQIEQEINEDFNKLNITIDSFGKLPTEDLYKQLVLYIDQVCIPDPLFEFTEEKNNTANSFAKLIGINQSFKIDRKKIQSTVNYIRSISELINSNFVIMLPISLLHEVGEHIPIKYSPNAFSKVLPQEIMDYYRSIASVYNLSKYDGVLKIECEKSLEPGTNIYVEFAEDHNSACMYSYLNAYTPKIQSDTASMQLYIPDSIGEEEFYYWVNQSINQAAIKNYRDRYNELVFAHSNNCMYLTQSKYVSDILKIGIGEETDKAKLANLAMELNLPVSNCVSITDLLTIRKEYGESFYRFRYELNSKLKELDEISDKDTIRKKLETLQYELCETQVKRVDDEYRKLIRKSGADALIMAASLISSFTLGDITAVGAAATFANSIKDVNNRIEDFRHNNGFFLWKVKKLENKISV